MLILDDSAATPRLYEGLLSRKQTLKSHFSAVNTDPSEISVLYRG
jgi:hypothetical protein